MERRHGQVMKNVHGKSVTGGSFPTTIWRKYMAKATEGLDSCDVPDARPRPPATTPSTLDHRRRSTTSSTDGPAATTAPTRHHDHVGAVDHHDHRRQAGGEVGPDD